MKVSCRRACVPLLAAGMTMMQPVWAYEIPLEPRSVREGYFFGQRNDERLANFLADYLKHFPLPQKGPYISEIELLTPYAQVMDISRRRTAGYSAQQAAQDYKKRGDVIQVRVHIEFTATYGGVESRRSSKDSGTEQVVTIRPVEFWKDFQFRLSQKDQTIEPLGLYGEPIFYRSHEGSGGLAGAQVWLEYDAKDVDSADAAVEVLTPDGQKVSAKLDLEKLR